MGARFIMPSGFVTGSERSLAVPPNLMLTVYPLVDTEIRPITLFLTQCLETVIIP